MRHIAKRANERCAGRGFAAWRRVMAESCASRGTLKARQMRCVVRRWCVAAVRAAGARCGKEAVVELDEMKRDSRSHEVEAAHDCEPWTRPRACC